MDASTKGGITTNDLIRNIITFEKGIPGFENLHKYTLLDVKDNLMFKVLQSVEDNNIGFIVISPFDIKKSYEIDLNKMIIKNLGIQELKDVLVLNTVTLNKDFKKITVNLKAPIIININNCLGEQIILDDSSYELKHRLVEE